MKIVTKVICEGRTFFVLKGERDYRAVEDKFIKQRKLLNGAKVLRRDSLDECLDAIEAKVKIDTLIENSFTFDEAAKKVYFG